jgi:putative transposase
MWESAWKEFIPFLDYDMEIRRVISSTNAIESLNDRYRGAVRARGHFPDRASRPECLYLVTRSLDPTGVGRTRWTALDASGLRLRYHLRRPIPGGGDLLINRQKHR